MLIVASLSITIKAHIIANNCNHGNTLNTHYSSVKVKNLMTRNALMTSSEICSKLLYTHIFKLGLEMTQSGE